MSWKTIAAANAILQFASLAGFILISAHVPGALGKQVVVALAAIGLVTLVYRSVRNARELVSVSLLIALEWFLIFHLVGWAGFPGLLRDFQVSESYAMACLRSASMVLVFALAVSSACLTVRNTSSNRRLRSAGRSSCPLE